MEDVERASRATTESTATYIAPSLTKQVFLSHEAQTLVHDDLETCVHTGASVCACALEPTPTLHIRVAYQPRRRPTRKGRWGTYKNDFTSKMRKSDESDTGVVISQPQSRETSRRLPPERTPSKERRRLVGRGILFAARSIWRFYYK